MRTISNRFLASLSAADLFVELVIDPIWIASDFFFIQPPIDSGLFLRHRHALGLHMLVSVDFFNCDSISFPLSGHCYKEKVPIVIILVWSFLLALSSSTMLVCDDKDSPGLDLSFAFMMCVNPLLVVIFCYIFMLKEATNQCSRKSSEENYQNHAE